MKKVSVYTRDGRVASSSYYRIWQYFDELKDSFKIYDRSFVPEFLTKAQYNNVRYSLTSIFIKAFYHLCIYFSSVICFAIDCIIKPDTIVILRGIVPKTFLFPANILYSKMIAKCDNVIWDFDDDIFLNHEISNGERELLEKHANHIIVTHEGLKKLIPKKYWERVILLPTTDGDFRGYKIDEIIEERNQSYNDEIRLIWLTSSSGLNDIPLIEDELENAAVEVRKQTGKQLTLVVVCNKPFIHHYKFLKVENIKWTRKVAIQEALKGHIGIMPLRDTDFSRGKGGFKIIQYMAAGLPAIASAIGFNIKIISNEKTGFLIDDSDSQTRWASAIRYLASNENIWRSMSKKAFEKWKAQYSYSCELELWKDLI